MTQTPRTRRSARVLVGACAALLLLGVAACEQKAPGKGGAADGAAPARAGRDAPARTDNVVLYVVDSLRADRTGVHGYHTVDSTPRLEALAAESAVFMSAYAPAPWTLPSLVSLMMTTVPCEHGVLTRHERLPPSAPTFARRLRRAGYGTVGLFATTWAGPRYGLQQGFEIFEFSRRTDGTVVAAALDRVESPFFLYVHGAEPRDPMEHALPERPGFTTVGADVRAELEELRRQYVKATRADFLADQPIGTTDNTDEQQRLLDALTARRDAYSALYDAAVRTADDRLGSVIDALKARGVWDSTIFIVCSTGGAEFGEHGGWFDDQSVYEELIHVPLLIRFPGGEHAGVRVQEPVSLIDVMPTVFEYLKRPGQAKQTRGRSLMPLLAAGGAPGQSPPSVVSHRMNRMTRFAPHFAVRGDENIVVRAGPLKLIWNLHRDTTELYDLAEDPAEAVDLAERRPKISEQLLEIARSAAEKCGKIKSLAVPVPDGEADE